MISSRKVIATILFLASLCVFTLLHAQQKSPAVFQFTNGFIYGKNDSLKYSGTISIYKNSLSVMVMDGPSGKKNAQPPLTITKVEHNIKEDLDFVADKPVNLIKLPHCKEVLHIYTSDNSDFLFAFENGRTYLILHNNFTLVRFYITAGDYFLLKSLFPG